jgi:hypothetical protein
MRRRMAQEGALTACHTSSTTNLQARRVWIRHIDHHKVNVQDPIRVVVAAAEADDSGACRLVKPNESVDASELVAEHRHNLEARVVAFAPHARPVLQVWLGTFVHACVRGVVQRAVQ